MIRFAACAFALFLSCSLLSSPARADASNPKTVLILVDGNSDPKNYALADGRQLASLLGHFNVRYTLKGVND